MLTFSALIAGSFSLGGLVANDIGPQALTAVRFIAATFLLAAIAFALGELQRRAFVAPWRHVILGALVGVYFVLMFEGLKTATPVATAAVFTLAPIISGIAGWFLLGQIATPRMALALGIGGLGAVWVIFRADIAAILAFDIGRGEVIFFCGCVAYAIHTPLMARLSRGESGVSFVCGITAAGAVVVTLTGLGDIARTDWAALPGLVWGTIAYLVIFASAATMLLIRFAALRLPAAKVMAYVYLVPSWTILWELVQGRTGAPLAVLPGIAATVVALLLLLRDEGKPQNP